MQVSVDAGDEVAAEFGKRGTDLNSAHQMDEEILPDKTKTYCLLGMLAYIIAVLLYIVAGDALWKLSISSSEFLSNLPGIFNHYFWIYSNPAYAAYHYLGGFLILLAAQKDSAVKSLNIFMMSCVVRNYVRCIVKEGRPIFETNSINRSVTGCNCSFGFPSGHSEGSSMFYSILIYELVIQNGTVAPKIKTAATIIGVFTVVNVMVSRMYYGMHSIPQVTVGATQGLFFFSLSVLYQYKLVPIYRKLLNGDWNAYILTSTWYLVVAALNLLSYSAIFDDQLSRYSRPSYNQCGECFMHGLSKFRSGIIRGFQYFFIGFGFNTGIYLLKGKYAERNHSVLEQHKSVLGLKRILLMVLCTSTTLVTYLPIFPTGSPVLFGLVCLVVYFLVGFTITFIFTKVSTLLGINLPGDIGGNGSESDTELGTEHKETMELEGVDTNKII